MARGRIGQGAGTPQVEEGKRELPSRRDFVKAALILTMAGATGAAAIPVLRELRAVLENFASGDAGEVSASDESLIIQEVTIEDVNIFLQGLGKKVDEIYELRRRPFGLNTLLTFP